MTARTVFTALALSAFLATPAGAADSPSKRDARGLPVGSYSTSCACQFSGGTELTCFCANVKAKWFRTSMDVRACPGPKDIKNCEGVLTCTAGAVAACPSAK